MSLRPIAALLVFPVALLLLSLTPVSALARGEIVVSVAAVSGPDAELSDAVTETLITDLARSSALSVIDARDAQTQSGAPYRVVGRCLTLDSHLIISVRVVDAATGRTVPGVADSATGSREDALAMMDRLADRIAAKLGERPLAGASVPFERRAPATLHKPLQAIEPSEVLPAPGTRVGMSPSLPAVPKDVLEQQPAPPRGDPWLALDRAASQDTVPENRPDRDPQGRYTALIVDTRGLSLERSMSPKLRREDGSIVWAGEEADPDFVIEQGIVVYVHRMSDALDHPRAGSHPLVIQAVARHDNPYRSDPILADDDADYVLRVARKDGFLRRFNVIFLID